MMEYERYLEQLTPCQRDLTILRNEPMSRHTTFQIGGPADIMITAKTESALKSALNAAREREIPVILLGNGSNVLVRDEGIRGVVLCLVHGLDHIEAQSDRIEAGAGALLSQIASLAQKASLTGLEFASGIPGTLGGALFMNAGAYDGQMSDVVETTRYMDEHGEIRVLSGAEHHFGYRHSILKEHPEWIALSAVMGLQKGDPVCIREKMDDLNARRREKQPLNFPSAGSTFKRPVGYFAGRLIEESGLKGYAVGGAQVSEKHAGFVINRGGASCSDVLSLIEHIQKEVYRNFHVELEPEVRIL